MKTIRTYIIILLAVLFAMPADVMAQSSTPGFAPDGVVLNKNVVPGSQPNTYTINLEAFVTGSTVSTTTQVSAPCDYVLVLDYSSSMEKEYGSGQYSQATRTTYTYSDWSKGNKTYTWDGVNYPINTVKTNNTNFTVNDIWWAYIEKEGHRYYLTPMGSVVKCDKAPTNADKYLVGENGEIIDPGDGKNGVLWSTISYSTQNANTRITALKAAASKFIDFVKEDAIKSNVIHRIGIIEYAGDSYPKYNGAADNDMKNYDNPSYSSFTKFYYSFKEYREELYGSSTPEKKTAALRHMTTVSTNNSVDVLKASLSNMAYGGATATDRGIHLGNVMMANQGRISDSNVAKIVVVFSDGRPENEGGKSGQYLIDCANSAVTEAKKLKDAGYTVYTIGLFESDQSTSNSIMQAISSNYPSATTYTNPGTKADDKYFKDATKDDLSDIFAQIAQETTSGGANFGLTKESTTVIDVVSSAFKLPDGANGSTITLQVAKCKSVKSMGTSGSFEYTFEDPVSATSKFPDIKAKVGNLDGDKQFVEAEGGKTVQVLGFDFSENYVGEDIINGDTIPRGYKLIISFPIEVAPSNPGGANVATNTEDSGIYFDEDGDGKYDQIGGFEIPHAKIPNLVIKKTGLHKGESATFYVYKLEKDGSKSQFPIVLVATQTSDDPSAPCYARAKIQEPGRYEVEESTWSWAYKISTRVKDYAVDDADKSDTPETWNELGYGDKEAGYQAEIPWTFGTVVPEGTRSIIRNVNDFTEDPTQKGTLFTFTNEDKPDLPAHGEASKNNVFYESR